MPSDFSPWTCQLASSVDKLIRKPGHFERFRKQCREFWAEQERAKTTLADWEQRRREHFEGDIKTAEDVERYWSAAEDWDRRKSRISQIDEKMSYLREWLRVNHWREGEEWTIARAETKTYMEALPRQRESLHNLLWAGQPSSDSIFEKYVRPIDFDEVNGHDELGHTTHTMLASYRWVPSDLHISSRPHVPDFFDYIQTQNDIDYPLVISDQRRKALRRVPSIAEQYATMACVRDAVISSAEPICDRAARGVENGSSIAQLIHELWRDSMTTQVRELPGSAQPKMEAFLADVEADLAEHVLINPPVPSEASIETSIVGTHAPSIPAIKVEIPLTIHNTIVQTIGRSLTSGKTQAATAAVADDGENPARNSARGEELVDDEAILSPAQLAKRFGIDGEALRKRLDRWRRKNHDGWIENTERSSKQAQYLYKVGSVRPLIDAMKASSKTSSKRPANKNIPQ